MRLTQKNFDILINDLNHKMTKMKKDIAWLKWMGFYIAGVMTVGVWG